MPGPESNLLSAPRPELEESEHFIQMLVGFISLGASLIDNVRTSATKVEHAEPPHLQLRQVALGVVAIARYCTTLTSSTELPQEPAQAIAEGISGNLLF